MRKACVFFLSVLMLLSFGACSINTGESNGSSNIGESKSGNIAQTSEPIKLVNKMTEQERSRTNKHALTLLDEPEETEHKVSILYVPISTDTDESSRLIESPGESAEPEEDVSYNVYALIDGFRFYDAIWMPENDENGLSFTVYGYNEETGEEYKEESVTFNAFEEYLDWVRENYKEMGCYSDDLIESKILQIQIVREAMKSGDYETLPEGSIDLTAPSLYSDPFADPFADYRNVWEYDREAVEEIKDSIDEISIYDEELNTEFLVHVTLPPNYDKDKTYPVFLLTDGVWRFGNHTELRKVMEDGEAADVILVSLGYNYKIDGTNAYYRFTHLLQERDKLLDFITDNLMPYLGENYNIDYASSSLYGHSNGGVFAHTALFKSDLYENQPFGNYIIGSPAFWGLYDEDFDLDPEGCKNDYGYFDRNDTLDKRVFLCGGSLEDPDYDDSYKGHDTTLEGLAKLNGRLKSHNANVTYKLYESHHYQFIPEMLTEFLKETYPK